MRKHAARWLRHMASRLDSPVATTHVVLHLNSRVLAEQAIKRARKGGR